MMSNARVPMRAALGTREANYRASRTPALPARRFGVRPSRPLGARDSRPIGRSGCRLARPRAAPGGEASVSPLSSLELKSLISVEGEVHPEESEGVKASVFGIFDQAKQLQFVGFSKDLKNSLRTMLGRQYDLAYYYKHVDFAEIDQQAMIAVREAWFEENCGPPIGNTPAKVQFWQQPLVAGGVSEKGKQVAARQMLETVTKRLAQRGLREELVPNEDLLLEGKVEFLPARELTAEEKAAKAEQRRLVLEATRTCATVVDGKEQTFLLYFENVFEANGGEIWTRTSCTPFLSLSFFCSDAFLLHLSPAQGPWWTCP